MILGCRGTIMTTKEYEFFKTISDIGLISNKIKETQILELIEGISATSGFLDNEGMNFRKGQGSYTRIMDYINDDLTFKIDKKNSEQEIFSILESNDIETNTVNYGSLIISLIKTIYTISNQKKNKEEFNIYYDPEYIFSNDLFSIPDEFSDFIDKLDFSQKYLVQNIRAYYDIILESFIDNVKKFISSAPWFEEDCSPFYYNSVDIFIILILHYWIIITDKNNIEKYEESLASSLTKYFEERKDKQDINDYFRSKFRYLLYDENSEHSLYSIMYPKEKKEKIKEEIDSNILSALTTEYQKSTDYFTKCNIVFLIIKHDLSELDNFLLEQFAGTNVLIRKFLHKLFRIKKDFVVRNQSAFVEYIKHKELNIRDYTNELINLHNIEIETEEDKIHFLHSSKRWKELALVDSDLAHSLLISATKEEDLSIKKKALLALEYIPGDIVLSPLLDALTSKDEGVISIALRLLEKINDEKMVEPLLKFIKTAERKFKYKSIGILCKYDKEEIDKLINSYLDSAIADEKSDIYKGLMKKKRLNKKTTSEIIRYLNDQYKDIKRKNAANLLNHFKWIPSNDEEKIYYWTASKLWEEIYEWDKEKSIKIFEEIFFNQERFGDKISLTMFLVTLDDKNIIDILLKAITSHTSDITSLAAQKLSQWPNNKTYAALEKLLDKGYQYVIICLADMGTEKSHEILINHISCPEYKHINRILTNLKEKRTVLQPKAAKQLLQLVREKDYQLTENSLKLAQEILSFSDYNEEIHEYLEEKDPILALENFKNTDDVKHHLKFAEAILKLEELEHIIPIVKIIKPLKDEIIQNALIHALEKTRTYKGRDYITTNIIEKLCEYRDEKVLEPILRSLDYLIDYKIVKNKISPLIQEFQEKGKSLIFKEMERMDDTTWVSNHKEEKLSWLIEEFPGKIIQDDLNNFLRKTEKKYPNLEKALQKFPDYNRKFFKAGDFDKKLKLINSMSYIPDEEILGMIYDLFYNDRITDFNKYQIIKILKDVDDRKAISCIIDGIKIPVANFCNESAEFILQKIKTIQLNEKEKEKVRKTLLEIIFRKEKLYLKDEYFSNLLTIYRTDEMRDKIYEFYKSNDLLYRVGAIKALGYLKDERILEDIKKLNKTIDIIDIDLKNVYSYLYEFKKSLRNSCISYLLNVDD